MAVIEGTDRMKSASAEYDFAVDGGAIGTIPLRAGTAVLGSTLPAGAVVMSGYIEVDTPLAGATATAGISVEAASDVQAAVVVTGAPWSTTGRKNLPFAGVKTTVPRSLRLEVAVAALTAGRFRVVLIYR